MSDNGLEPGPVQSKVRSQKMILSTISCILVATSKRYVGLYNQEQLAFFYVLLPRCCCSPANRTQVTSGQLASSVGHITIVFQKMWYPRRSRKGKFHIRQYIWVLHLILLPWATSSHCEKFTTYNRTVWHPIYKDIHLTDSFLCTPTTELQSSLIRNFL